MLEILQSWLILENWKGLGEFLYLFQPAAVRIEELYCLLWFFNLLKEQIFFIL